MPTAQSPLPVTEPSTAQDAAMSFLDRALDHTQAQTELQDVLCQRWNATRVEVIAARLFRYKPGRRCLIEYDLLVEAPSSPRTRMTLVGKARAKGADQSTFGLLEQLWGSDFGPQSRDGLRVPEPIGLIPSLHMYLMEKVPGTLVSNLLPSKFGLSAAVQMAEMAFKLHASGTSPFREHTAADEFRILTERLLMLARNRPQWGPRIERVLADCSRMASRLPPSLRRPIHRDFYPGQMLVGGQVGYLLDFDLCAWGDPAVDVGNCLAHLTEQSLRVYADASAFKDREAALLGRYLELNTEVSPEAIAIYSTLSLARHIFISTQLADRTRFAPLLLELCERRLGLSR